MKTTMIVALLGVALAAAPTLATLFPLFPVGDSVWPAGSQQTISWRDSGSGVNVDTQTFKIELQTGTDAEQVTLAVVGERVAGSAKSISFTIPDNVGPSGKVYFFRFTPTLGDIAWSTRFTVTGATGTFPSNVKLPPGSVVDTAPDATTSPVLPTPSGTASVAPNVPTPTATDDKTDSTKPTDDAANGNNNNPRTNNNNRNNNNGLADSAAPQAASLTGQLTTMLLVSAGIAVGALLI